MAEIGAQAKPSPSWWPGAAARCSPIAPVLAHVLSHAAGLVHGTELPPHPHRTPAVSAEPVKPGVA